MESKTKYGQDGSQCKDSTSRERVEKKRDLIDVG